MMAKKNPQKTREIIKREKAHFSQLLKKGELLWWITEAGKVRMKRRSQIVNSKIKSQVKVLEIGAGSGQFSRYLVKPRVKLTTVEFVPKIVQEAKKKLKAKNIKFVCADAHHLPFKANSFDLVVGNSILHHLDLNQALTEIKRVLKNQGRIIFFEPNMANPQIYLERHFKFLGKIFKNSPDETAFFRWVLKRELEKHGFQKVEVQPFDFLYPFTPRSLIKKVTRIGLFLEKIPVIKEFSGSLFISALSNKPTLKEVKAYWNQNSLYSMEIKSQFSSKEYFEEIEKIKKEETDRFAFPLYRFKQSKGRKILDVGCGPGFLTRYFAQAGAKVTAVDLAPVSVKLTKQALKLYGLKAKVRVANVEKLPFADHYFDQVVCHGVIHHTPDYQKAIGELSRVVKKGGRVVVAVYYLSFWLKPMVFPLTARFLKMTGVKPIGRKQLVEAHTVFDFVRQYDGSKNPLVVVLSKKEWCGLLEPYFKIEKIETHYFPKRFILGEKKLPGFLFRFLDQYLGTMIFFSLKARR